MNGMRFLLPRLLATGFLFGVSVTSWAKPPNVLLLCIDDLRPELHCYGVDYIHSPHIDSLAKSGRLFTRHYVQAPTCGASRYALLTGTYGPADNGALFAKARNKEPILSMPRWFRMEGYTTVSVGKVSHHPGGRGGPDWNDEAIPEMPGAWDRHLMPCGEWQHPRGAMHGLAHGEIRKNARDMAVYQSEEGGDEIYPDGLITDEALKQLKELGTADKPFFLAVGIIRPHLPFGCPEKYLEPYKGVKLPPIPHPEKPKGLSTWHGSGEFRQYNQFGKDIHSDQAHQEEVRRHYAACVTYADAQVGRILAQLDAMKLRDNTIIVLWGDHGWHLGEHAIWGKHSLYEESLRSPLIFSGPGIPPGNAPIKEVTETIDVFPTLCHLSGIGLPEKKIHGQAIWNRNGGPDERGAGAGLAISYQPNKSTVRSDRYRLIVHNKKEGKQYELYDHNHPAGETLNLADQLPGEVERLDAWIDAQLKQ